MAFFKKLYTKLLGEEGDEEEEDAVIADTAEEDTIEEEVEAMTEEKNIREFSAGASRSLELKIAKLSSFDGSVMEVADHLIAGRPVVLNLEAASKDAMKRIIDFFSGVAYTVRGQLKNISGGIYIVTPNNVDVSGDTLMGHGASSKKSALDTSSPESSGGSSATSPYEGF